MSACKHSRQLNAYYDGELAPEERSVIEEHVRQCPSCARELEQLRGLSRLFAAAQIPEIPADALQRLHSGVRRVSESVVVGTAGMLTAAAAAVLLVCSLWLGQMRATQETSEGWTETWETAALTPRLEVPSSTDGQMRLAQWIVADLSRENGHD